MPSQDPRKNEQLTGTVSVWSNSYGVATGYGVQVKHLIDRLKRHGLNTAMLSNFGLEGKPDQIKTPYGLVDHFPRGWDQYSNDVAPWQHQTFAKRYPDTKDLFISLYDVWVMTSPLYEKIRQIASWVPVDHVTIPANVLKWLERPNVYPITMAPNGSRIMQEKGIEHSYVPHSVDTKIYKPTHKLASGQDTADYLGSRDKFVVGMVAANKASGAQHRKAFGENLLAFSIFKKRHPDAILYMHTDPTGATSGWKIPAVLESLDLKDVVFPDPMEYRIGYSDEHMAALYTAMDVLLAPSLGEGFGVPTIEAQACGTRVITSSWAASQDLTSEDSWQVDGQPLYDPLQGAWWMTPSVPSIVAALEEAYQAGKAKSVTARSFAKQFDTEKIWFDNWMPTLKQLLA